jgi:hypothetical protein
MTFVILFVITNIYANSSLFIRNFIASCYLELNY